MGIEQSIDPTRLPLFVGAGVIKSPAAVEEFAAIPELAVQVIGSFSTNPNEGNDPTGTKRVFYYDKEEKAAYNAVGLKNPGWQVARQFLPEAIKVAHDVGQAVIVAVTSLEHEDAREVLPDLAESALETGADGVELTLSCPNEGTQRILCLDVHKSLETVSLVRERIGAESYLMAKVSPLREGLVDSYKARGLAVDGVAVMNTYRQPSPVDLTTGKPFIEVNDGQAGLSGPVISDIARANLRYWVDMDGPSEIAEQAQPYDIWSVGGVDSGAEIYRRHKQLGAYLVGAAQRLYRSDEPATVIAEWAREYRDAVFVANDSW